MSDFENDYVTFDVWLGGVVQWVPTIRYVDGWRMMFPDVDIERIFYHVILDMYKEGGGKALNVIVYWSLPGMSSDNGIRILRGDEGIVELSKAYKNLPVISIYIEEKEGPLLVLDTQGNVITSQKKVPSLPFDFEHVSGMEGGENNANEPVENDKDIENENIAEPEEHSSTNQEGQHPANEGEIPSANQVPPLVSQTVEDQIRGTSTNLNDDDFQVPPPVSQTVQEQLRRTSTDLNDDDFQVILYGDSVLVWAKLNSLHSYDRPDNSKRKMYFSPLWRRKILDWHSRLVRQLCDESLHSAPPAVGCWTLPLDARHFKIASSSKPKRKSKLPRNSFKVSSPPIQIRVISIARAALQWTKLKESRKRRPLTFVIIHATQRLLRC
ncbi:hypothetical protein Salat_0206900 [Sesamum alatum]|uniref:PB1-like domain-containing protein n=1 Tax=Sesamum alatum TaxID=300844 RepID=A0AAE2CY25_9LAMI|nr:hypothetical protein Salat_0206900 [Sesamum alatum]